MDAGEAAEGQDVQLRRVTLSRCEPVVRRAAVSASHFTSHAAHIIFPIKAEQKKKKKKPEAVDQFDRRVNLWMQMWLSLRCS